MPDMNFSELEATLNDLGVHSNPTSVSEYKSAPFRGTLTYEMLQNIRRSIADKRHIESVMANLQTEQLIELQNFLWHEAMEHVHSILQQDMTREYITSRMESTANYHRRQMCSEPLSACRANFCIHSNPACAGRKLKDQIRALSGLFDRRTSRSEAQDQSIGKFLSGIVRRFGLSAAIVTTDDGMPVAAVSNLDRPNKTDSSEFVNFFYRHLERYARSDASAGSVYYDVPLQAVSHKLVLANQTLILTLLSVRNVHLDVAMFRAAFGVERICLENNPGQDHESDEFNKSAA